MNIWLPPPPPQFKFGTTALAHHFGKHEGDKRPPMGYMEVVHLCDYSLIWGKWGCKESCKSPPIFLSGKSLWQDLNLCSSLWRTTFFPFGLVIMCLQPEESWLLVHLCLMMLLIYVCIDILVAIFLSLSVWFSQIPSDGGLSERQAKEPLVWSLNHSTISKHNVFIFTNIVNYSLSISQIIQYNKCYGIKNAWSHFT